VVEALGRLPLPMREVLVLHHCLDLPVDTVAIQTGVSVGTVKSRLSRGRERLAELLAPDRLAAPGSLGSGLRSLGSAPGRSRAVPGPSHEPEEERHGRP